MSKSYIIVRYYYNNSATLLFIFTQNSHHYTFCITVYILKWRFFGYLLQLHIYENCNSFSQLIIFSIVNIRSYIIVRYYYNILVAYHSFWQKSSHHYTVYVTVYILKYSVLVIFLHFHIYKKLYSFIIFSIFRDLIL